MVIQFKKNLAKQSILTCIRKDGSTTWSKLHKGMETHDLAHYAVEVILGFDKAFYGILINGYDIKDFELPNHEKPQALLPSHLDPSAIQTEQIVNLLQIEFFNTGPNENFLTDLKNILTDDNLPFPEKLNQITLDSIREEFSKLLFKWGALKDGEILKLQFPK